MKKIALFLSLFVAGSAAFSQSKKGTDNDSAPYLKVPYTPPFKILLTDSTWFAKEDLPKHTPVVVMYFSPDCSHCQMEVKEIVDSMQYFEKAFFVLASYKKMPDIVEFSDKYKLNEVKNMKVGRDTAYFLPTFYRVKFTPFIGVYDEDGKLLQTFPQGAKIEELKALLYDRKHKPASERKRT